MVEEHSGINTLTRKLVLIGFMGAGKSTVGRILAHTCGLTLYEMDAEVVARSHCSSVAQIFEEHGEVRFRDLESEVARDYGAMTEGVISCGGGVIGRSENIELLRQHGAVFIFLHASFEGLAARVAEERDARPLFTDPMRAQELYHSRLPTYRAIADIEIATDAKSPEVVAAEALNLIAQFQRARSSHISGHSALTLIIGDPVAHSLSPRMHNAGYVARNLPFVMAASHVLPADLEQAIAGVRALKIRGLAVTMPHKVEIMPYLDAIDPVAREIGAVNTVVNNGGVLTGYNTDWRGIIDPLSQLLDLKGVHVAVLGAGGAAQAAIYGCINAGAQVTIINRTVERATQLATRWGCGVTSLDDHEALRSSAVIINTTSVGMHDSADQCPIPRDVLHSEQVIFETIYAPRTTQLVAAALERGARVIRGVEMFVAQGVTQFELHTGYKPPYERMRQVVMHQSS